MNVTMQDLMQLKELLIPILAGLAPVFAAVAALSEWLARNNKTQANGIADFFIKATAALKVAESVVEEIPTKEA